jgi:3-deoxy-7-phosphoheptulonate synthase
MLLDAVQNLNVRELSPLTPPARMWESFRPDATASRTVMEGRDAVRRILLGEDPRLLVIVGPCSIHDPAAALDYARRLKVVRDELRERLFIVMRVYFEKPRTRIGWKGLINDPHLDGSMDIETGLRKALGLMQEINALGVPVATEFLDPIIPQYLSHLVSWAAIGARTTESQTHRQMASGLSMPVGFKNGTDGSLQIAIDAMASAMNPHSFVGIDSQGMTCVVRTSGNPWGHMVLRGGSKRTNYDPESIAETIGRLEKSGLSPVVMVDCSHANSEKKPERQEAVWNSVVQQRAAGNRRIIGLMVESNLEAGSQSLNGPLQSLKYGVSVTDPCIDWSMTERLLREGHKMLA